jgi:hypothetical protein
VPLLNGAITWSADPVISNGAAGAAEGPVLKLLRDSASSLGGDLLGKMIYQARNSAALKNVAAVLVKPTDETPGSEDAELLFRTIVPGALTERMILGQGLRVGAPTGGDKGVASVR